MGLGVFFSLSLSLLLCFSSYSRKGTWKKSPSLPSSYSSWPLKIYIHSSSSSSSFLIALPTLPPSPGLLRGDPKDYAQKRGHCFYLASCQSGQQRPVKWPFDKKCWFETWWNGGVHRLSEPLPADLSRSRCSHGRVPLSNFPMRKTQFSLKHTHTSQDKAFPPTGWDPWVGHQATFVDPVQQNRRERTYQSVFGKLRTLSWNFYFRYECRVTICYHKSLPQKRPWDKDLGVSSLFKG